MVYLHRAFPPLLCAALALGQSLFCQTFEVASIRPSGTKSIRGWEGGPGSKDPTRYTFGRADLLSLILTAYDVENFQVSSKLPLDRDQYDLAAKLPENATKTDLRNMLLNLLADRFQMKLHRERGEFSAFEMVPAKGGVKLGTEAATRLAREPEFPKLAPGKPGLKSTNSAAGGYLITRILGQQQPLFWLAKMLRTAEPFPVVDKTGLTGVYDFALRFAIALPNSAADISPSSDMPDLTTALREQLGLQLIEKKLPFDVVVVDSFLRVPTEN